MKYVPPIGGDPDDPYTDANPAVGVEGSLVPAAAIEHPQREIENVIIAAGLAPNGGNLAQLAAAIQTMIVAQSSFSTGDVKLTMKTVADLGWIMMDDGSIGNAESGATTRAHADTQPLFTLLWNNVANAWAPLQDNAGNPVARGANAADDFAVGRRLVLPRTLGRALSVSGAGSGLTSRALGQALGAETHTLTNAQMTGHRHIQAYATDSQNLGRYGSTTGVPSAGWFDTGDPPGANATRGSFTSTEGGGQAFNIMQPSAYFNVMIKL